jgi:hypothetical protein
MQLSHAKLLPGPEGWGSRQGGDPAGPRGGDPSVAWLHSFLEDLGPSRSGGWEAQGQGRSRWGMDLVVPH